MSSARNTRDRSAPTDSEIIRVMYSSLFHEGQWSELLSALTRTFNATYSVTLTQARVDGAISVSATDALPLERQRAYERYYSKLTPKTFFASDVSPGHVLVDQMYEDYDAYLRSELYNDFFRPLHADHLMFLMVHRDGTQRKSLVLRRGSRVGAFRSVAIRRFQSLGQHLSNRERIRSWSLARDGQEANLGRVIDRLNVAALVVDSNLVIRYMTNAAEELLCKADLFRGASRHLVARNSAFNDELKAAISDCTDSLDIDNKRPSQVVRVPMSWFNPPAVATFRVSTIIWIDDRGMSFPAALLVINDPTEPGTGFTAQIARLFGLTPAEERVATALCRGHKLADYAKSAGISIQTARTLLKRVFAKTGSHSQSQLISMIIRGAR